MKIFPKLLISYLLLSLLPLLLITLFTYNRWSHLSRDQQIDNLSEILKSRMYYISQYFENMEKKAAVLARSSDVATIMSSSKGDTAQESVQQLRFFSEAFDIGNIDLIDKEGTIIYSLNQPNLVGTNVHEGLFKESQLGKVFEEIEVTFQPSISEFESNIETDTPAIFVGAPIMEEGTFIGVLTLRIPPDEIYKIFHDYTSLGKTGEVLIAVRKEGHLLFVNPIRHKPHSAFTFTIEEGSPIALPMQQAVQQIAGRGVSIDYRNKEVLAVWDYLPQMRWGIVVKMDSEEALAPVKFLANLLLLVGFGTLIIVIFAAIWMSKKISKPIEKLQKASIAIGKGNFDVAIDVNSSDELGDLAHSFTLMVKELHTSMTSVDRLNEEIEQRKKMETMRKELISRISHELRTPISPIKEGIELVLDEGKETLSPVHQKLLSVASTNVHRLLQLMNDVLAFYQLSSGVQDYRFANHDLNKLLLEVMDVMRPDIKRKGLQLSHSLSEKLPMVRCHRDYIKQAFSNLLGNAIKFSEAGEVVIQTNLKKGYIEVRVSDTGIGMLEKDLEKLFHGGFRELHILSSDNKQGAGLGLVIAQKIIEEHGGKIWAESTLGEGATFFFTLPIKEGEE